ncbi:hypothetical protein FNI38_10790 [Salmonella enterica subsp. diarizonae]|nr:hypothetical protein [Salmonella enterica subsp. diarizonae]
MPISNELIDELLKDCHSPEDLLGESGLLKQLTRKLAERALEAEMSMHPGYTKHDPVGNNSGNSRNGTSAKTVRSQEGELEIRNESVYADVWRAGTPVMLWPFTQKILQFPVHGSRAPAL